MERRPKNTYNSEGGEIRQNPTVIGGIGYLKYNTCTYHYSCKKSAINVICDGKKSGIFITGIRCRKHSENVFVNYMPYKKICIHKIKRISRA